MEKEKEKLFQFNFSFADIITIVKGLKKLPYEESAEVIYQINNDYLKQQKELEVANKKQKE